MKIKSLIHIMPKINKNYVLITATIFALLILFAGIGISRQTKAEDMQLLINNTGSDYVFDVFLNGEPIYSGEGLSLFSWNSFPVRRGDNDLYCKFSLLPGAKKTKVRFEINFVMNKNVEYFGEFKKELTHKRELEKKFSFVNKFIVEELDIDQMPVLYQDKVMKQKLQLITMELIDALSDRDLDKLSNVLNLNSTKDLYDEFPSWFLKDKDGSSQKVEGADDIEVVFGNYFALSKASDSYIKKTKKNSLFVTSNFEGNSIYRKNSFIFLYKNNQIYLVSKNRKLHKVD